MDEHISDRREGLFLQRKKSLRLGLIVGNGSSELPNQVVAFCEQRVDTALAFWDIRADVELAINAHIINRIELLSISTGIARCLRRKVWNHTFIL